MSMDPPISLGVSLQVLIIFATEADLMGKFCGSFGSRMRSLCITFTIMEGSRIFVGFVLTSTAPKMAHLFKQPFIILQMKITRHLLLDL